MRRDEGCLQTSYRREHAAVDVKRKSENQDEDRRWKDTTVGIGNGTAPRALYSPCESARTGEKAIDETL